jgi:hypothetical protein
VSRKLDLKVNQEVIIRYINDKIRYEKDTSIKNIDSWTTVGTVTKIGRKYLDVEFNGFLYKFDMEWDYREKVNCGSPNYKLYLSKEEILDEIKAEELYSKVRDSFDSYGGNNGKFTLNQLERIKNIIDEE